jgi:hypothetical protein
MDTAPETDFQRDEDPESPRWLGSVVRRGLEQPRGSGWDKGEDGEEARPKWLGSVARREGSHTSGDGWVEPDQSEQSRWLGSAARRGVSPPSLVLVDMGIAPTEQAREETPETRQGAVDLSTSAGSGAAPEVSPKAFEPSDELDDLRQTRVVAGEIGMHLRVA